MTDKNTAVSLISKPIPSMRVAVLLIAVACGFAQAQIVQFRPEVTDASGAPVSSIGLGDSFTFTFFVQDLRAAPQGIFSAYTDVFYDEALFAPTGPVTYHDPYLNGQSGDLTTPGIMETVGAVDGISVLGGEELPVFSVPMVSLGVEGIGSFDLAHPDAGAVFATTVFGLNVEVDAADIQFLSADLSVVVPEPGTFGLFAIGAVVLLSRRRVRRSANFRQSNRG